MAKPTLSLADLNTSAKCETPFEFEFINEHDEPTGLFISVIGAQAPAVKKASYARVDKKRIKNELLKKAGKEAQPTPFEEDVDDGIRAIASTIVGWRGVAEPYDAETAYALCKNNDLILNQVKEASENIANFTKVK